MTSIPLSLYVHIPWCVKKCPYCDFNSHQAKGDIPEERYSQALINDLESELPQIQNRSIESIFIGGGTPSLYSADAMNHLLSSIRERLIIHSNTEITMEANPGTFEQDRFSAYRQSGVNRLSIGIQSFNDKHLKVLGRIHGGTEAQKSTKIAKQAGFYNFNLDIMYGLPKQTISEAISDLQQAIDANPSHISWYQLTIEENTLFHYSPPITPDDEMLWEMQQQGQKLLEDAGYYQYEVSAYAKENQQCQHNINYWQFGDYLGIGAGAHGKISTPDGNITRHTKFRHPEKYMTQAFNGRARSSEKKLATDDLIFEFMLNAARIKDGFTQELFETRTLLSFSKIEGNLNNLLKKELIQYNQGKYRPTEKGWQFVNDIVNSFI